MPPLTASLARLETPAPFLAWNTDEVWSVLITHRQRTVLVHGSAGFEPDALTGRHADVVYTSSKKDAVA